MGKIFASIFILVLFVSLASADLLVTQQPKELYNLGNSISIEEKVVAVKSLDGFLVAKLICSDSETEIHREYFSLQLGDEKKITITFPILKSTGATIGTCAIKTSLNDDFVLTNEFQVSDLININATIKNSYKPGETVIVEGTTKRENNEIVNGFVELNFADSIKVKDSVKNGKFKLNFTLPEKIEAGEKSLTLKIYEKINEEETNKGNLILKTTIEQIPTTLKIIATDKFLPGEKVEIRTILHDQTEKEISSTSSVTIKDSKNKIIFQQETPTSQVLAYTITEKEAPASWTIVAVSNKLSVQKSFEILEKSEVKIQIVNQTAVVENLGNVLYNKTIQVKVGDKDLFINADIPVGETREYRLTAPDGNYNIEVIADGKSQATGSVFLTGDAISISTASGNFLELITHPIVWIFVIVILAIALFLIFRKTRKKSFYGKMSSFKPQKLEPLKIKTKTFLKASRQAVLSLSIKGNEQPVSAVCLKIKNLREIQATENNAEETLQRIVNLAENKKAATYENQDYLVFILSPSITKTFQNEKSAVDIAQKAKEILDSYNRVAKQKIIYGISLTNGEIVAQNNRGVLEFIGRGSFMSELTKISSHSAGEILLGPSINTKVTSFLKTELKDGNVKAYAIRDFKNRDDKTFLNNFVKRYEERYKE